MSGKSVQESAGQQSRSRCQTHRCVSSESDSLYREAHHCKDLSDSELTKTETEPVNVMIT